MVRRPTSSLYVSNEIPPPSCREDKTGALVMYRHPGPPITERTQGETGIFQDGESKGVFQKKGP